MWMIYCYLRTLVEAFQVLIIEFSQIGPNISGLFVPQCSLQNKLKKKCKQKDTKKMKWLQKAKITVIIPKYHNPLIPLSPIAHKAHSVPLLSDTPRMLGWLAGFTYQAFLHSSIKMLNQQLWFRRSRRNDYRRWKWIRIPNFESWTDQFVFFIGGKGMKPFSQY